jgi:hypothetical protein
MLAMITTAPERTTWCSILLLFTLIARPVSAQETEGRRYLPDRADEEWGFLATEPRVDFWDPLKYISFGRDDWFMTLSAELRLRSETLRVRPTPARESLVDTYLLQRYLFGADVRLGPRARVFTEVQSGLMNGSIRTPRPTDRNKVDLHQAFFEWRQPIRGAHRLSAKIGRQELAVGSTRLISASPGLNVKRSFDGVTVGYRAPSWTVIGTASRLVSVSGGAFDDKSGGADPFWGVAAGRRSPWLARGEVAAYYLGTDRDRAVYFQGIGGERRHTLGLKWTAASTNVEFNNDGIVQWGTFEDAAVRAWAVATETALRTNRRWRPRLSVRADIASGDDDAADPRLQSFNPLFPGNSYSGAVGLLGPTNLTDLTPALSVFPRPNLMIGFEMPNYWRTSTADGVYATDLRLLFPATLSPRKYVGSNPGVLMVWGLTRHVQLQAVITRFIPGEFLKDTFISSGFGFFSGSFVYRF